MSERKKRGPAGDKTICVPMGEGIDYSELVNDTPAFRAYLDQQIAQHPELFPEQIKDGYCLHGFVKSDRMGIVTRRIRLKSNRDSYQLRPDTVMPYMIGKTEEVEKGLYLRRYGLPYEGIAHVFRTFGNVLVSSYPSIRTNINSRQYGQRCRKHSPLT
jgi:hypothetical protein